MIKPILFLLLSITSSYSFSQKLNSDVHIFDSSPKLETIDKSKYIQNNMLTLEKEQTLNNLLITSSYQDFFDTIKKYSLKDEDYIKYLLSKSDQGHIPTYWLIADYYAKKNEPKETHKWLYIATIMTQQDSYLCHDITAKNAPRILLKSFPETVLIVRKTPQYIQQVMSDVFFFIYNIKQRINPDWACKYGNLGHKSYNTPTIPKQNWEQQRQDVLKRFSDKYMN